VAIVATLSPREVVDLCGPDSRRFANGMFTNNVRDLPVGAGQRSAMTDDRGRLQGLMELYALADDHFRVVLEGTTAEAFSQRYERYVVFDDVEIEPLGRRSLQTVQGDGAQEVLRAAGLPVPEPGRFSVVDEGLVAWRDRGGGGYDLVGLPPLPTTPAAADEAERLRIRAGQVCFPGDVVRPGLPHEHGLRDAVLHFEKGCYLGQESIHRIEVMGKPRRALAIVRLARLPEPTGDAPEVHHEGRAVGKATSLVALPDGGALALAVLRKPAHERGTPLTVAGIDGEAVALPERDA